MSVTSYDAPPSPASGYIPQPAFNPTPTNGQGNRAGDSSTTRNLLIALAVVSLIAIVLPVALLFALGGDNGSETTVATAPDTGVEVASTDDVAVPAAVEPATNAAPAPADPAAAPAAATQAPAAPAPAVAAAAASGSAPVVTQLTGQAPAVYKVTGISAGSSLNVRQSAGTTNPLIGTLANNATDIAGTGRRVSVDGNEWREIKFANGTGWVFGGYLTLAPAPAAAATPVPTPAPIVVTELAVDSPAIYRVTGVSTGASLNVRAEPGASQRLLGTLAGDTSAVPATGRRSLVGQTEWREIGFRTGTGWVNASYLTPVPEVPETIMLPAVASTTVGIVPLTSPRDRLVLRAEPGYDQTVVGTVGASAVNITATGRKAQIGSEVWSQVTASGVSGWVPSQLTIPVVRSAADVIATNGVAAVVIDKVVVAENGDVMIVIGTQSITVANDTTVTTSTGRQSSITDWAQIAKTSSTSFKAEVTVVGNQATRLWVA